MAGPRGSYHGSLHPEDGRLGLWNHGMGNLPRWKGAVSGSVGSSSGLYCPCGRLPDAVPWRSEHQLLRIYRGPSLEQGPEYSPYHGWCRPGAWTHLQQPPASAQVKWRDIFIRRNELANRLHKFCVFFFHFFHCSCEIISRTDHGNSSPNSKHWTRPSPVS